MMGLAIAFLEVIINCWQLCPIGLKRPHKKTWWALIHTGDLHIRANTTILIDIELFLSLYEITKSDLACP